MKNDVNDNEDKQASKMDMISAFCSLILGGVMYWYADKYFGTQNFVFDPRSEIYRRGNALSNYK